jgi:hypothetical protein
MLPAGLYDESGPRTEEADIYAQSVPMPVALNRSSLLSQGMAMPCVDFTGLASGLVQ